MNSVTAVVLAGGVGKRFWPMTIDKNLFPFFGKPLIQYNIEQLKRIGIGTIIVVTNPQNNDEIKKLGVVTVLQSDPRGMAGALLSVKKFPTSSVFVMNGDDIVDAALYDSLVFQNQSFLVGKKASSYFDGGYITKQGTKVTSVVEKPGAGNEPGNLVAMVLNYFPDINEFTKYITDSDRDDVYEQALNNYVKKVPTEVIEYSGNWSPCKYPHHALDITKQLLETLPSHRGKNIEIKDNAVLEGNIWLGNNVKIYENTKITGPCFIGDNTIIGNNVLLRESLIGANCVVGFQSDIARSYIGDHCWFHANYIGDSVLENNISMGSGTVLANLRLDEKEIHNTGKNKLGSMIGSSVRIGVNASIMPGIKIGSGSFIGAGVVLDQEIQNNSFITLKSEFTLKQNQRQVSKRSPL